MGNLSPEIIEGIVRAADRNAMAVAEGRVQGPLRVSNDTVKPFKPEPVWPTFGRGDEIIIVKAAEVYKIDGLDFYAQCILVVRTRIASIDSRKLTCSNPTIVNPDGVYVDIPQRRGRGRFVPAHQLYPFDPFLVFSGKREDKQQLRFFGMRFSK